MGLFTTQKHDIGRLHYILKLAFERIKSDMHNIFQWVTYFHQKHQEHDERLAKIEQRLAYAPQRDEIKQIVDYHAPKEKIEQLYSKIMDIHERIDHLEAQKPAPRAALKERLMRKISKNSKEYIKSVILGTIKKYGRISGPQLKEIVVEEQGICSKSSFYRLLQEIEEEQDIASFTEGKEKTYFLKTQVLK
ncbi:hypothetical protein GOV06_01945 [Candidatus Woesearchaeota archaeon]|nr:hypothetical protein [Candidatus Woesearchaeota archaeon]